MFVTLPAVALNPFSAPREAELCGVAAAETARGRAETWETAFKATFAEIEYLSIYLSMNN